MLLDELQPQFKFALEEIDILSDADLYAKYRYEIPVLLRDGEEIARGRINDRELTALLKERRDKA